MELYWELRRLGSWSRIARIGESFFRGKILGIGLSLLFVVFSEKGPLPEEILVALDDAWSLVKPSCPPYWR